LSVNATKITPHLFFRNTAANKRTPWHEQRRAAHSQLNFKGLFGSGKKSELRRIKFELVLFLEAFGEEIVNFKPFFRNISDVNGGSKGNT
jgi:hypothetical protein